MILCNHDFSFLAYFVPFFFGFSSEPRRFKKNGTTFLNFPATKPNIAMFALNLRAL